MEKGEDKIKNSPGGPGKGYINLPPRRSESCGYWLWLLAVLVAVSLEHKKIPPGEPITRGESFLNYLISISTLPAIDFCEVFTPAFSRTEDNIFSPICFAPRHPNL